MTRPKLIQPRSPIVACLHSKIPAAMLSATTHPVGMLLGFAAA